MKTLISIVMPVHNTPATYLKESLDSIVAQTFSDWELIIVDDYSDKEETRGILRYYCNLDERVSLIWLNNPSGAAMARNIGLDKSIGKYVIFLDSDDVFDVCMLEKLFRAAEECNAEMSICGHRIVSKGSSTNSENTMIIPNGMTCDSTRNRLLLPGVPWNRLCLRSFLIQNDIRFQSLPSCNDVAFFVLTELLASKISVVSEALIDYSSGTKFQISSKRDPQYACDAYEYSICEMTKRQAANEIIEELQKLYIRSVTYAISACTDSYMRKNAYERVIAYFHSKPPYLQSMLWNYLRLHEIRDSEENCVGDTFSFLDQLRFASNNLLEIVADSKAITLWGLGKRGMAFLKWAQDYGVTVTGIYDKDDYLAREVAQKNSGIKVYDDEKEILDESVLIIASNSNIYNEIRQRTKNVVIDLERYCPM